MRLEIFAQLHTLSQFDLDSQPRLPLILAGQNNLVDKLMFHASRPLALRIIGRSHLEGLKLKDMTAYLNHHLQIADVKERLFTDEATLAIHQDSGGLLRRANLLAKGAHRRGPRKMPDRRGRARPHRRHRDHVNKGLGSTRGSIAAIHHEWNVSDHSG